MYVHAVVAKVLVCKKYQSQAKLAIAAQQLKQKYKPAYLRWHQDVKAERDVELEELKLQCKKLNHRGRNNE